MSPSDDSCQVKTLLSPSTLGRACGNHLKTEAVPRWWSVVLRIQPSGRSFVSPSPSASAHFQDFPGAGSVDERKLKRQQVSSPAVLMHEADGGRTLTLLFSLAVQ